MPIVLRQNKSLKKSLADSMKSVGGAVKRAVKKIPKPKRGKGRGKVRMKKTVKKAVTAKPGELFNKQRADYEKAMNSAQKKGGSNGVGVGY